jgi:hypothetical protein
MTRAVAYPHPFNPRLRQVCPRIRLDRPIRPSPRIPRSRP